MGRGASGVAGLIVRILANNCVHIEMSEATAEESQLTGIATDRLKLVRLRVNLGDVCGSNKERRDFRFVIQGSCGSRSHLYSNGQNTGSFYWI